MQKKMVDRNPITGASLRTGVASKSYQDNYDAIFNAERRCESSLTDSPNNLLKKEIINDNSDN
jgi:hypothetical protein